MTNDVSGGDDELLARGRAVQAQLWPRTASGPTGQFPAAKLARSPGLACEEHRLLGSERVGPDLSDDRLRGTQDAKFSLPQYPIRCA